MADKKRKQAQPQEAQPQEAQPKKKAKKGWEKVQVDLKVLENLEEGGFFGLEEICGNISPSCFYRFRTTFFFFSFSFVVLLQLKFALKSL